MRRFFNSMVLNQEKVLVDQEEVVKIASMKVTPIALEQDLTYKPGNPKKPSKIVPVPSEPGTIPLAIVLTPRASYTDDAREGGVKGDIRFKLTLSEDGFIPKIVGITRRVGTTNRIFRH
jgi:hypothetical protein